LDRELLIAAGPGEWRAALLEDGVPVQLFVERGDRSEAGSIHLGRVRRLVPSLGAAMVDIGGDRPGFLPLGQVVPRSRRLDEGERVLVQIRREAQGGKAARVTMAIALRGRLVELTPGRPGLAGGERLPPEERTRLLAAAEAGVESTGLAPHPPVLRGEGRGEGQSLPGLRLLEPASIDMIAAETAAVRRRWGDILDRAARLDPPVRLDPMATFAAALAGALPGTLSQILVDCPGALPDIRAAFPGAPAEHRSGVEWPIDFDAVFDQALHQTVALRGGAAVHIEATPAAVLIDVDTGTPETGSPELTGLAVNLAAAAAVARQLRLRNLGGGIVVDFVGLESRASRERVRAALAEALALDPAQPQVLGWTRLGHLELVRPRHGRPLAEVLLEPRPVGGLIKTAVTVAHEALRALRREARAQPGRNWRLIVAPDVATALAGGAARAVQDAEERFARKIAIEADPGRDRERFQIAPL
jgi:Rne/Rng family ribonuclease